jgi:dihydroorotate dehydrogenase (fumarate)
MNLTTSYLGLELKNPFIVGASPLCDDLDTARVLQDSGASALVLRSMFEEQLEPALVRKEKKPPGDELDAFADYAGYQFGPEEYLRHVARLKETVTIPVIASINGHHAGNGIDYARRLERAGANAIELNFYQVVTDPTVAADDVESDMLEMVHGVSGAVRIPIAAKISPFHTSVAQLAVALELAGAAGVVVFNRFYQPDIDINEVEVQSTLRLSDPSELLLRLRWLAILSPLLRSSLAVTGGVHNVAGAVKSILCGAHAIQLVSVLLRHGPHMIATLREGMEKWMREHGYKELEEFRGLLNHAKSADASAYERANYIRVLQSWRM